jgi:hypothetical protein
LSNAGRGADKGYLYLVPKNFKEEDLMQKILLKHVLPGISKESQPPPMSPNSTSYSQRSDASTEDENVRCVLTCDGDLPQLNAIFTQKVIDLLEGLNIDVLKFSAACSLSQQPNDMHRGFPNLARVTNNLAMKYSDLEASQQPVYMVDLAKKLKEHSSLTSVQMHMMLNFFQHAPTIFARAFSPRVLIDGYKKSGLAPYDSKLIMENCSEWRKFNFVQAQTVMDGIDELVEFGAEHGWITESEMDRVGIEPSPQNWHDWDTKQMQENELACAQGTKKSPKGLNELTETRQRAMWLNAKATLERRAAKQEAKKNAAAEKVRRALEREQKTQQDAMLRAERAREKEEQQLKREEAKKQKQQLAEVKKSTQVQQKAAKALLTELDKAAKEEKRLEAQTKREAEKRHKEQQIQAKKRRVDDQVAIQDKGNALHSKVSRPAKSRKTSSSVSDKSNECASCLVKFSKHDNKGKGKVWQGCEYCGTWWCKDCAVNVDAPKKSYSG